MKSTITDRVSDAVSGNTFHKRKTLLNAQAALKIEKGLIKLQVKSDTPSSYKSMNIAEPDDNQKYGLQNENSVLTEMQG